ncbi:MAG: hypothetical protein ACD_20C00007G0021 [uncultured bacterium]|nr:MAG: hypothetical protein ACD_20C00007G0021 [uncultured bacterium]HBH18889.1 hypothetical protein [Cyanobacteria bacterium UBA9579]
MDQKVILDKLRDFMKKENLDFFIVNATDEYLSEYIKLSENSRYIITGFSGSTGDALVTLKDVYLFVDGRYHLQADNETDKKLITVVKVGMEISPFTALVDKITELSHQGQNIALVSTKISYSSHKRLNEVFRIKGLRHQEYDYDPILEIADIKSQRIPELIRYIPTTISGITAEEKFGIVKSKFDDNNIDIYVLSKLEEIAYITNLRGDEIPYSSVFKAKAIMYKDKISIFTDKNKITRDIKEKFDIKFEFLPDDSFLEHLNNLKNIANSLNIGFNPNTTNLFTYRKLEDTGNKLSEIDKSPITQMMTIKNQAELDHMQDCFRRTDIVVNRAIVWLNQRLENEVKTTEKDFADKVKALFIEEGAYGLSFEVIAASGKNTAIIHYTNPDSEKPINKGELVLLDCGAYFEGGYATDMTRTFLAGGRRAEASNKAKEVYTTVLKGVLNGLYYHFTSETTGYDIDKTVREVVTKDTDESFKFAHGTGHGVGIAVHEAPPRISPAEASKTKLEVGMCFTIEPGLYNDNWGGVRIENTVTVIHNEFGRKIKTLTRSKFDENLIDYDMLNKQEIEWLEDYQKRAMG